MRGTLLRDSITASRDKLNLESSRENILKKVRRKCMFPRTFSSGYWLCATFIQVASALLQQETDQVPLHILAASGRDIGLLIGGVGVQGVAVVEHLRPIRGLMH